MLKDILKKIPGFRTGKKWKMAIAVIVYLGFFLILTNPTGVTLRDKLLSILGFLILIGIPFVLITNLGNIRSKLPIFNRKTTKANILGAFVTLFIMVFGFSMVNNLKSSEQKQLDLLAAQQAEGQVEIESEAKKAASDLNDKIMALGVIESLTYDKANEVLSIRKEYEALTSEQKGLVTKLDLLELAEKKIKDILTEVALSIDEKITALGNVESLTLDKADTVMSIRNDYEILTSEQKMLVTKLELLESAEKKIKDIMAEVAFAVDNKIMEIGNVESLTYDKADFVMSIRKEFEDLTSDQKLLITNLVLLESAEKKIADLKMIANQAAEQKAAEEKAAADQKAAEERAAAEQKAAEEKAAADQKAAEEKAAEDYQNWINNQFSAWDGSHTVLVKLVKENLNDPKSFEHVETVYWDKGTYIIVKMTYRAKNGFGALILQNVTANADYASDYISIVSQND